MHFPVPVIVVGNIFIGGTGKSPFTIWLVQTLRRAGYTPGVISRGYGRKQYQGNSEVLADSTPALVGDEPLLIARRAQCAVMVGRHRVAAAQALLQAHPEVDVIISDDGLQHYALQRDMEIVLFDGRGVGNGWLLPAGPLREAATRRRDFTVVNLPPEAPIPAALPSSVIRMQLFGDMAERLSDVSQRQKISTFNQPSLRVLAAAGIGNPQRFFDMLTANGVHYAAMPLPDHYDFSDNPFVKTDAEIILITEKDAVKCRQIAAIKHDPRIWVVPVDAQIDDVLAYQIVEKLRGYKIA